MTIEKQRYYWIDWIRFLAAFFVLLVHTRGEFFGTYDMLAPNQKTILTAVAFALTRGGNEAVMVFFVLSGFLVGGLAAERISSGSFSPRDFAIDRVTRIMVPLLPSLVFTGLLGLVIHKELNIWHFIGNVLSLQGIFVPSFSGNGPLWSLAYEVWFYVLVWAVGVFVMSKKLHVWAAVMLIVVAAIFTKLYPVNLFCWLVGMFAFIKVPQKNHFIMNIIGSIFFIIFGYIVIQVDANSTTKFVNEYRNLLPSGDAGRIILAFGIALLIQQLIKLKPNNSLFTKVDSIGTNLAAFSYTLYLIHLPILQTLHYYGVTAGNSGSYPVLIYFLLVVFCLLCAWLLYLLFEKRTAMIRKWLKDSSL